MLIAADAASIPIDNFFEWKAIKGGMPKQPYAIGMKSGEPFALAAGELETTRQRRMGSHLRDHHYELEPTGERDT